MIKELQYKEFIIGEKEYYFTGAIHFTQDFIDRFDGVFETMDGVTGDMIEVDPPADIDTIIKKMGYSLEMLWHIHCYNLCTEVKGRRV